MDISQLPNELFLEIALRLSPCDLIRSRRVSRSWLTALTSPETSLLLLRCFYPRCREMRLAAAVDGLRSAPADAADEDGAVLGGAPQPQQQQQQHQLDSSEMLAVLEYERLLERPRDWAAVFAAVARRYDNLSRAAPESIVRLRMACDGSSRGYCCTKEAHEAFMFDPAIPPREGLSRGRMGSKYVCGESQMWDYSAGEGLLVYPKAYEGLDVQEELHPYAIGETLLHAATRSPYRLLDIETGAETEVPFVTAGKTIRRVRLASSVLVFEWAETELFDETVTWPTPTDARDCYRHYVTAFDVVRARARDRKAPVPGSTTRDVRWTWRVTLKAEWRFFPPNGCIDWQTRWYSAHDERYYLLYISHRAFRDRPAIGVVWDMDRRVSRDGEPTTLEGHRIIGPEVIRHYRTTHVTNPKVVGVQFHNGSLCLLEESHCWRGEDLHGGESSRGHQVSCTSVPIVPPHPHCLNDRPVDIRDGAYSSAGPLPVVEGPPWYDVCGADDAVNFAFCSRQPWGTQRDHGDGSHGPGRTRPAAELPPYPRLLPRTDAVLHVPDAPFVWEPPSSEWSTAENDLQRRRPPPSSSSSASLTPPACHKERLQMLLLGTGGGRSNSADPFAAPCWRHEEFPYVTVAEAVDHAAGVRFAARYSVTVEFAKHTPHAHLSVTVPRPQHVTPLRDEEFEGLPGGTRSGRSEEAVFPEELWQQFLGGRKIAGDERWLIGQGVRLLNIAIF